jgi:hypothetical protein
MRDLTLSISSGPAIKKVKSSVSILRFNLAVLASIFLLGGVYLFTVNSLGTKGYEIRKLEERVRGLEADQKALQLQSSDLQSINRIQASAQKLNYVPVSSVSYLKGSDYALK